MSNTALNWAWLIEKLTPIQKLILIALADYADKEGYCWPAIKSLSERCNVVVRTIQRNLKVLEDNDLIMIESRERKDGSSTSNGYLLAMPIKEKLSPLHAKPIIPSMSVETCCSVPDDTPRSITEPPINPHTSGLDLKKLSLDNIPPKVIKSFKEGVSSGKIKNKPAYLNKLLSNYISDEVVDNLLEDKLETVEIYNVDGKEIELRRGIKHFENLLESAKDNTKEGLEIIIKELKIELHELMKLG